MLKKVLVTGATGKIGSQLVPRLAAYKNIEVRAFVRDAEKAAPLKTSGTELALGTFEDPQAVRAAVEGVDTLVLITLQNPNAANQASAVLVAAKEAGVRKVVRLSVFKAAIDGPADVTRLHGRTDTDIQASGLTYVILQPLFFMQNLLFMAARSIASDGKLYFGTGDGKLGMIDLRDIVDCAERSVVSDEYDNQIFLLSGPESISFQDISDRFTQIFARPIQYVAVPPEAMERSIRALGMGNWYAQVIRDLCKAYRENWGDVVTDAVPHITGHPARSFEVFAREIFAPALKL
jgi:uncharacterized protein YbjT (DUF2867 family)